MGLERKVRDRLETLFASILVAIDEDDATQFWVRVDRRREFDTPGSVLIDIYVQLDTIYLPNEDIQWD